MSVNTGGGSGGGQTAGSGAGTGTAGSAQGASAQGSGSAGAGQALTSPPSQAAPIVPPGGQSAPADWSAGMSDEYKGLVQNKGWKAPTDALESYRNLEKLLGAPQDKVIRMPGEDDQAGWDSVYTRLGRPATPDAYKLEIDKDIGNPELAKSVQEAFFKAGLSEKQAKLVADNFNQFQKQSAQSRIESLNLKSQQETAALKKEWGAKFDENVQLGQRAVQQFGVEKAAIIAMEQAIGTAKTFKFFQSLGEKMGDSRFVGGVQSGEGGPMTPAAARSAKNALMADQGFVTKYLAGDVKARARVEQLSQFITAGQDQH